MSTAQHAALRIGAALTVVAGLTALAFAIHLPGSGSGANPVAVRVSRSVTLPDPGLFGSRPTLYGVVAAGQNPPAATSLGCVLRSPTGGTVATSDMAWVNHSPQVVKGRSLTALLSLSSYPTGSTLVCTGPAAAAAAPTYLLSGGLDAGLARVVLVGFGLVAVVVGAVATQILRPRRPGAN